MTTKKILIICGSLLGICIVAVGLCIAFLTNGTVRLTPEQIRVEKVEDKYYLIASYASEYKYKFKIEQKLDNDFVFLKTVETENNVLELSDDVWDFSYGVFRFSACYTTENGAGGKYTSTLQWAATHELGQVDYSSVIFNDETLTWSEVPMATSYSLNFIAQDGAIQTFETTTNEFTTQNLKTGAYKVYIIANSTSEYLTSSFAGEGKNIVLQRKNEIISASIAQDTLTFVSAEQVQELEFYIDEKLYVMVELGGPVVQEDNYLYTVEKIGSLLGDVHGKTVKLRSCSNAEFLQSDLFELSL